MPSLRISEEAFILGLLLLSFGKVATYAAACAESPLLEVKTISDTLAASHVLVNFKVSSSKISASEEKCLSDMLRQQMEDLGTDYHVYCRAASSPDGPSAFNGNLAEKRLDAMLNVLEKSGIDMQKVQTEIVSEDYHLLLLLMQAEADADMPKVRAVVEANQELEAIERGLREVDGGILWKRLVRDYFPQLRGVGVVLSSKALPNDTASAFIDKMTLKNGLVRGMSYARDADAEPQKTGGAKGKGTLTEKETPSSEILSNPSPEDVVVQEQSTVTSDVSSIQQETSSVVHDTVFVEKVVHADEQVEEQTRSKERMLTLVLIGLASLLCLALVALFVLVPQLRNYRRQIAKLDWNLTTQSWKLEKAQIDVAQAEEKVADADVRLKAVDKELQEQVRSRESGVSVFVELVATYVNKLNAIQQQVVKKAKGHGDDASQKAGVSSRMTEREAREFFAVFDRTFLECFPDFVENVNNLFGREGQIAKPDAPSSLNLDLRILALMRLGVKDCTKIATLLNCSQQTIYNHRSSMKNAALSKDTFDTDVLKA